MEDRNNLCHRRKLLNCGLRHCSTLSKPDIECLERKIDRSVDEFTYVYKDVWTGCFNIDMDDDVIYMTEEIMCEGLENLLGNLLGRFKGKKYVVIHLYTGPIIKSKIFGIVQEGNDICVYRLAKKHGEYLGVCHGITIKTCDYYGNVKFTCICDGIVSCNSDMLYITFNPPLLYDRMGRSDCYLKLEWNVFEMSSTKNGNIPRLNKLEAATGVRDKYCRLCMGRAIDEMVAKRYMGVSLKANQGIYKEECNAFRLFFESILKVFNEKAIIIQRQWRRCITDPKYVVCFTRLQREYEMMC